MLEFPFSPLYLHTSCSCLLCFLVPRFRVMVEAAINLYLCCQTSSVSLGGCVQSWFISVPERLLAVVIIPSIAASSCFGQSGRLIGPLVALLTELQANSSHQIKKREKYSEQQLRIIRVICCHPGSHIVHLRFEVVFLT